MTSRPAQCDFDCVLALLALLAFHREGEPAAVGDLGQRDSEPPLGAGPASPNSDTTSVYAKSALSSEQLTFGPPRDVSHSVVTAVVVEASEEKAGQPDDEVIIPGRRGVVDECEYDRSELQRLDGKHPCLFLALDDLDLFAAGKDGGLEVGAVPGSGHHRSHLPVPFLAALEPGDLSEATRSKRVSSIPCMLGTTMHAWYSPMEPPQKNLCWTRRQSSNRRAVTAQKQR